MRIPFTNLDISLTPVNNPIQQPSNQDGYPAFYEPAQVTILKAIASQQNLTLKQAPTTDPSSYIRAIIANRPTLSYFYSIAYAVAEIRSALMRLKREVFMRSIVIEPAFKFLCTVCNHTQTTDEPCPTCGGPVVPPSIAQFLRLDTLVNNCNAWSQTLLDVLKELEDDLNIADDAFLVIQFSHAYDKDNVLLSIPNSISRHDPASIEFDLDKKGLPENTHFFCLAHREIVLKEPHKLCTICEGPLTPAMYKATYTTGTEYLADFEVIHVSKFNPSKTYGIPPIITLLDSALAVQGVDTSTYNALYKRKAPRGMYITDTVDPESFAANRDAALSAMISDPNHIPWLVVKSPINSNQSVKHSNTEFFPFAPEANLSDSAITRLTDRINKLYGVDLDVSSASTAAITASIAAHAAVDAQVIYNDNLFVHLLQQFKISDWLLRLPVAQEFQERAKLNRLSTIVDIATKMHNLGFEISLDSHGVPFWTQPELDLTIPEDAAPDAAIVKPNEDAISDEPTLPTNETPEIPPETSIETASNTP